MKIKRKKHQFVIWSDNFYWITYERIQTNGSCCLLKPKTHIYFNFREKNRKIFNAKPHKTNLSGLNEHNSKRIKKPITTFIYLKFERRLFRVYNMFFLLFIFIFLLSSCVPVYVYVPVHSKWFVYRVFFPFFVYL